MQIMGETKVRKAALSAEGEQITMKERAKWPQG